MAISPPRSPHITLRDAVRRFSPAAGGDAAFPFPLTPRGLSHASPVRRAPGGSSPIRASASIVLPEPDSPTMPSVSPSPSANETSFTGRTKPERVGSSTVKPRASRRVAMGTSYVQREGSRRNFASSISCVQRLAASERDDETQGRVRFGEAADFVVGEIGGYTGCPDVRFANVRLALGIDDPDRAGFLNRARERLHFRERLQIVGAEQNHVRAAMRFLPCEFRYAVGEILQKRRVFDTEHADPLSRLDAELIEQGAVRIIALGFARLLGFLVRHAWSSLPKEPDYITFLRVTLSPC